MRSKSIGWAYSVIKRIIKKLKDENVHIFRFLDSNCMNNFRLIHKIVSGPSERVFMYFFFKSTHKKLCAGHKCGLNFINALE